VRNVLSFPGDKRVRFKRFTDEIPHKVVCANLNLIRILQIFFAVAWQLDRRQNRFDESFFFASRGGRDLSRKITVMPPPYNE